MWKVLYFFPIALKLQLHGKHCQHPLNLWQECFLHQMCILVVTCDDNPQLVIMAGVMSAVPPEEKGCSWLYIFLQVTDTGGPSSALLAKSLQEIFGPFQSMFNLKVWPTIYYRRGY